MTAVAVRPTFAAPASGGRIVSLDGYRAVASIAVLASHTAGEVGFITRIQPGAHLADNLGNFGVAVFFVLSGFVNFRAFVAASLQDAPVPDVPLFLARRGLRIFPGYWVALLVWAIAASPTARAPGSPLAMFLLLDPYNTSNVWLTGLYVSWSLTVEIAFYLVLPFYALGVHRVAMRRSDPSRRLEVHLVGLVAMVVVAYGYRMMRDHWDAAPFVARNWLPSFFDWFALGMLLAVLDVWRSSGGRLPGWLTGFVARPAACWTCAAASYLALVVLKGDQLLFARHESAAQMSWRFFFQGLAAFFFVLPAVLGSSTRGALRLMSRPTAVYLGTISYGIYLWHPVVMLWLQHAFTSSTPRMRFLLLTPTVFVLTVPIAHLSYHLVEMPFMRLYRVVADRRRSGSSTSAPVGAVTA